MRSKKIVPLSSELTTETQTVIDSNVMRDLPELPIELQGYMVGSEAEPGSKEWFQEAFDAVAQCAIDNGEYLTNEFLEAFEDKFEDETEWEDAAEEMKREAGLESLC